MSQQSHKNIGFCHICHKHGDLSFEHIPPKAAFNKYKIFFTPGSELLKTIGLNIMPWDFTKKRGIKRVQRQGGMGQYTFCTKCNNLTGHWYADALVEFIKQAYYIIYKLGGYSKFHSEEKYFFQFHQIYPLRIIKEILAMFFSINSPNFSLAQPELQALVLDKNLKGINMGKYALYIYLMKGTVSRYIGISGTLNVFTGRKRIISELSAPPFGFVLEIDPQLYNRQKDSDIVNFANDFTYDEKTDLRLTLNVKESNSYFPLDYRTQKQIIDDHLKNVLQEDINKIAKKL